MHAAETGTTWTGATGTAAAATALVVPIDVVGLCIGANDAESATNGFAGATTVYAQQVTDAHAAYLARNISRPFDFPPWDQLEVGAHLHWAMPDGLTRGGGPGAELDFPAAPSRWLITRIAITGGTTRLRSWLVESDALTTEPPPSGTSSVTLPYQPDQTQPPTFAYLGRTHDLTEGWSPARSVGGVRVADATGKPLTVVSNGEVGFAAYYPSCRGVFGFWDDLADLTPPRTDPARLAYAVVGWYDQPADDPVQPGATVESLQTDRGWTVTGGLDALAGGILAGSVYTGVLQGIRWSPDTDYVLGQSVQQPLTVNAAIGNTGAEALAAYFMGRDHPNVPLFETLLDAFQSGLLETFQQPTPDGLSALQERLHAQRYAGEHSGTVYSIVAADDTSPDPRELIDLPTRLAADLDQLNVMRQQADQCGFHADWYRWQLFADWYRIFMVDPSQTDDAYAVAQQRYAGWTTLSEAQTALTGAADRQYAAVVAQLAATMRLRSAPAARFLQPTDPVVVLSAPGLTFPQRYGSDGRFDADGFLVCRTADQLLTAVTVGRTTLTAAELTAVTAPAGLPDEQLLTGVLRETCLLSTTLLADLSGQSASSLETALVAALQGQEQGSYTVSGHLPSPVGVNWWQPDQWYPLFASWTVHYLPLQPTSVDQQPVGYQPTVLTANYTLDPDAGGTLTYAPTGGSGSITIDPRTAPFTQQYAGSGNLTPTPAQTLASQLTGYLATHTDATLSAVLAELTGGDGFLVAPLNGLVDQLVDQQPGVQLQIRVPTGSDYTQLTQLIAQISTDAPRSGGPSFDDGLFNPLRAGYLKLGLALVDVFGQQRSVTIPELICAASMTTVIDDSPVPSIAYLSPRVSQPARLAFRWLAADGTDTELLTANPAISPVCGWLLPNHVDGSLAVYDQAGRPLGILFREHTGRGPAVGWQSAPGDDRTVNEDLATVMAFQNPQLRELVTALGDASADFFAAMWKAIDAAAATVEPGPVPTDTELAALVGRPVAVVQAAVRLELEGAARLDLSFDNLGNDSDAGLTGIEFPVVVGDLAKLGDGLIGYFTQAPTAHTGPAGGYDLTTFYCQAAAPGAHSGVVPPTQQTVTVPPSPPLDPSGGHEPPNLTASTRYLLMLIDPRAPVHATTGVLPTLRLQVPGDQSQAVTNSLDLALFTAPVLSGAGGLAIPVPSVAGYALSFLDVEPDGSGGLEWVVTPDLGPPSTSGLWAFSPQQVREGWLRLNPIVLRFTLTGVGGTPVVHTGQANALTLTVTNAAQRSVTFRPGAPVAEGTPSSGSVFYLHLGTLVAPPDVTRIQLGGPDWSFQSFTSPQYGPYWAAAPTAALTLGPGEQLRLSVAGLIAAPVGSQAQVTFDYYDIDGIDDGVFVDVLTVAAPAATPAAAPS
ncbi:MAG TPA: hypothetical protein VIT41_19520 [Microlunatus sp.]